MPITLHQLHIVAQIALSGFHVSRAAVALNTSQSAVSKHLRVMEDELGVPLFHRVGKRLSGMTAEGEDVLKYAHRMLRDRDSIRRIGAEANVRQRQTLTVSATPTLARYILPGAVRQFSETHSSVDLHVQVEESDKAVDALRARHCDMAVVPTRGGPVPDLSRQGLCTWQRSLIALPDCPLLSRKALSLEDIAEHPIIAFETPIVSLKSIFEQSGLAPHYSLTTSNPEVMKAYVALGLGIAIIATPTFDPIRDAPLISRDVSMLFPGVDISVLRHPGSHETTYQRQFVDLLEQNS